MSGKLIPRTVVVRVTIEGQEEGSYYSDKAFGTSEVKQSILDPNDFDGEVRAVAKKAASHAIEGAECRILEAAKAAKKEAEA